jgi:hypothetical protein
VATLTDAGLAGTSVVVTDTVRNLPSNKGVFVCYQRVEATPPPPTFLAKCHGSGPAPCVKSLKEAAGNVVAKLVLPTGDPRFHVGGETPQVTGFSPTSAAPGKKITVSGVNLSEVTRVTIGGVSAQIKKTAPTKLSFTVPVGATSGVIVVTSQAGGSSSAGVFTVLSSCRGRTCHPA